MKKGKTLVGSAKHVQVLLDYVLQNVLGFGMNNYQIVHQHLLKENVIGERQLVLLLLP